MSFFCLNSTVVDSYHLLSNLILKKKSMITFLVTNAHIKTDENEKALKPVIKLNGEDLLRA